MYRRMKEGRFGSLKASRTGILFGIAMAIVVPLLVYGADRLVVKNNVAESKFVVTDEGKVGVGTATPVQDFDVVAPNNGLLRFSNTEADNTQKASRMVLRHYSNTELPVYLFGAASTAGGNFVAFGGGATIGNAATQLDLFTAPNTTTPAGTARLTIKSNGYVGIGTQSPSHPLHMGSGAHVTAGGAWTDASSREYKEDIEILSPEEAMNALQELQPVKFAYKIDRREKHVGFVAEEVPELVATKDRKGLSSMDIVAVLTKVVQEQERKIEELSRELKELKKGMGVKEKMTMDEAASQR